MVEDRDALRRHYQGMRDGLSSAIAGLGDEAMCDPSIDGWSVKDHLAHIAFWDDIRAGEVERISAGHASAWRMDGERDAVLNNLAYSLRREMSLDQARWELTMSRRRLIAALEAATPRGLDGSLYGEAGLRSSHEAAHAGWIKRWRTERGFPV